MLRRRLTWLILATCLALPAGAHAALTIEAVQKGIADFKRSEAGRYAPQTVSRAEAYLGAALLARDTNKTEDLQGALQRADETLAEAEQTANAFIEQYRELLTLRSGASDAVKSHGTAEKRPDQADFRHLIDRGERALTAAIDLTERGQLNQSRAAAAEAEDAFRQALTAITPWLSEEAGTILGRAASAGANKYAPVTYEAAKTKLHELRAYVDGISRTAPANPVDALHLANRAYAMTMQVKQWRKQTGSHEEITLQEMSFRRSLARELGIEVHANPLLDNTSERELLDRVEQLQRQNEELRQANKREAERLRQQYEAEFEGKLDALKEEMLQAKNEQLSGIKDAFRAKLEKETYETNRQKSVHALFKESEATIMANLDGSLLIRLQQIRFASGKSKIEAKYFDLLGRLKEALDIYADRNVRIEGHTDNEGEVKANQVLSLRRAEAVRDFLIAAGVEGGRLKALGYGEVRPVASNEFDKGREMNRRIDIAIEAAK